MHQKQIKKIQTYSGLLFLLANFYVDGEAAQPSAGSLMQQIQNEQPLMTLPPVQPGTSTERLTPSTPGQRQILIKQFKFVGNQKLSEQDLQTLLAPYKNKPLSFEQIKGLAELVTEDYRQKGWLARALIPAQDVTDRR
jgi:hemolysin activation/secretion protein